MSAGCDAMSERERFLFDLNGFIVLRGVLDAAEVAAANAAVDSHLSEMLAREPGPLRNAKANTPLAAAGARFDLGGMLSWPKPACDPFRRVLAHPRLVPYLVALCGEGYRMDHQPLVIAQEQDSEGFMLHGGPVHSDGAGGSRFSPELQYRCHNSQLWTSLLAVSVQLSDHNQGDGGFCVVRGSHKLNLPVPHDFLHGISEDFADHVHQPVTRAGDVVIWSEATVHGATPWRGSHQRRIALYRFAPANMGYGRGYLQVPAETLEGMTQQERAVLEPPYATRLDRPIVSAESALDAAAPPSKKPRSAHKKEFDKRLFGTDYF